VTASIVSSDLVGLAEDRHHRVDDVAGEFEHAAAGKLGELLAHPVTALLAHHGAQLGDATQPTVARHLEQELEGRIVAQHVTHLNGEPALIGRGMQRPAGAHRRPRRLVEVNVFAGLDAAHRRRNEIAHRRFHRHDLETFRVEQLFLRQPLEAAPGLAVLHCALPLLIRLDNADEFKGVRQLANRRHLAAGMWMERADLADADLGRLSRAGENAGEGERAGGAGRTRNESSAGNSHE
jgi:hypothetical protein